MSSTGSGRRWGDEEVVELRPYVLTPAGPVPDGKMPAGARKLVALAIERGARVISTYAVALVPDVLRKVDGQMQRVTETRESVAVRIWWPGAARRGYALWSNGRFAEGRTLTDGRYAVRGMEDPKAPDAPRGMLSWLRGARDALVTPAAPAPSGRKRESRPTIPAPRGAWLATGVPLGFGYPCRCLEPAWAPGRNCGSRWCPCWGRDDLLQVPPTCCGWRYVRTSQFC